MHNTNVRTNKWIQQSSKIKSQQISVACLYTNNPKRKFFVKIPFKEASERIKHLGINQKGERFIHWKLYNTAGK